MIKSLLCAVAAASLSTAVFAQSVAPAKPPISAQTGTSRTSQNIQAPTAAPDAAAHLPSALAYKDPQKQCVDAGEFGTELISGRNPVGDAIVVATNFLPTNQRVNVGVRTRFVDNTRYFAGLDLGGGKRYRLARQDVITRRAVETDTLVKEHLLEADQTIVTLKIADDYSGLWNKGDLYLYTCSPIGSPARVSLASVRLSPHTYSLWASVTATFVLYLFTAFILRKKTHTLTSFFRELDPVWITVGPDGRGSLSKFQVFSFTLVVIFLIFLFALQTGSLPDLSKTILILLGVNGFGATIAKGADTKRNAISPENRAWLLRRNWTTTARTPIDPSTASWRDFFTTNGEFDVYRYQSFIFTLAVIAALIFSGTTQLSTFAIPETILGIVGLSQAVYIGGKLVTPTNMSNLNDAITDLRDREMRFRDTATAAKHGPVSTVQEAITSAGQAAYDAYKDKARDVAALFTLETGILVGSASLEPSLA